MTVSLRTAKCFFFPTSSDALRSVWLFSSCDGRELAHARRFVDELEVGPETVLLREGERAGQVLALVDGSAVAIANLRPPRLVPPGSTFGEASVLANGNYPLTLTTLERSRLLVIEARAFLSLIERVPKVCARLAKAFAGSIAHPTDDERRGRVGCNADRRGNGLVRADVSRRQQFRVEDGDLSRIADA